MAYVMTEKILGDGQVASAEGDIYLVPLATTAYVKAIRLCNTNVADRTVYIYIKKASGTSRLVGRAVLSQYQSSQVLEPGETWPLGAGDAVRALDGAGTSVDFVVLGLEHT